jgi:hypothetical protein
MEYYDVDGRREPRPPVETPGVHLSPQEEADRCIFCQIIHGRHAHFKVLETAYWYAFLDTRPLSQRHTLVVPKGSIARLISIMSYRSALSIAAGGAG